jgi:hypothetical protein
MPLQLRQFLSDAYESRHLSVFPHKTQKEYPIQIDDQDDNDKLHEFCNVFCTVLKKDTFRIELFGKFPITPEMADLAEIYNGEHDTVHGRLVVKLHLDQIDVLTDLADKIRKTSFTGIQENPSWLTVSSRTISSLYRFVRIIKEYTNLKNSPNKSVQNENF